MTTFIEIAETNQVIEVHTDARDSIHWWGRALASDAPNDDDVMAWDDAAKEWVPVDVDVLVSGTYVDVTGDTMTGDLIMDASNIIPLVDGTGSLGLTGTRWGNGFFDALDATSLTGGFDGVVGGNAPAAASFTTGAFSGLVTASSGIVLGGSLRGSAADGSTILSGGSGGAQGGNLVMYGQGHATRAKDWAFRSDTTEVLIYDESAGTITSTADWIVGASKFVVTASTGVITTPLVVSSTGPHALGGAVTNWIQFQLRGAYISGGGASDAVAFRIRTDLTSVAGDDSEVTLFAVGGSIGAGSITTQNNSETIDYVSTVTFGEPDITKGTDTITHASSVRITGAPTEGGTINAGLLCEANIFLQVPNTVSGTGLMVTTNDGSVQEIMRDSSTRREKLDIRVAEIDPAKVLGIYAQEYGREAQPGLRFTGFCVEDFHEAGFTTLLDYNELGQPTAFREYGRGITALQQVVLQDHEARIEELEEELAMLKAA